MRRMGLLGRCIVVVFATGALVPTLHAAPVFGRLMTTTQPDGTVLQVRVWGDEFYRVVESTDGYTLTLDPATGYACYAALAPDGTSLVSTGVPVGDPGRAGLALTPHLRITRAAAAAQAQSVRAALQQRAFEGFPALLRGAPLPAPTTTGNVKGICLIVDFSDAAGTITPTAVDNFCNQVGYNANGNNGSVRDYYTDVSDGALTYTNYVPTAYYRATKTKAYYNDPNLPAGTRARELITEALQDLNAHGFDFSQYDANHDGFVDALNCFYAGNNGGVWGYGLWPHQYTVSFSADGVSTLNYQISDMGSALTLGTFCHENGHMLCNWPDLYDYDYDSYGAGQFCLMALGTTDTNPCEPCAYLKYVAGWSTTTNLTTAASGLSLAAGSNTFYRYVNPSNSQEYFIIENRQKTGRDAQLPDAGIAIWHIDENGSNDFQQQTAQNHYEATLLQADGDWDLEHNANAGDNTDLYASPGATSCNPFTTPNTDWWAGTPSNLDIYGIGGSGAVMTFNYRTSADCNNNNIPDADEIAGNSALDCNGDGVLDACSPAGPVFTAEPHDRIICAGSSTSWEASATGTGTVTYQWYFGSTAISGATGATLTLSDVTTDDAGTYKVVATDTCGSKTSGTALLTLFDAAVITTQPQSRTAETGESVTWSVVANGAPPLTYQWYFDGNPVAGATHSSYTIPSADFDDAGGYRVVVSTPCGSVTSTTALLTVMLGLAENPSPANSATEQPLNTELMWDTVASAAAYDVYFGTAANPPFYGSVKSPHFVPPTLAYGTTYYWRVAPIYTSYSRLGPIWSFSTNASPPLPAAAAQPYPADGATNLPVSLRLTWAAAAGATRYDLTVSTHEDLSAPLLTGSVAGSFDLLLDYGTTYYWQVTSLNEAGETGGPVWHFATVARATTGARAESPSPSNNTNSSTTSNSNTNSSPPVQGEVNTVDEAGAALGCPVAALVLCTLAAVGALTPRRRA